MTHLDLPTIESPRRMILISEGFSVVPGPAAAVAPTAPAAGAAAVAFPSLLSLEEAGAPDISEAHDQAKEVVRSSREHPTSKHPVRLCTVHYARVKFKISNRPLQVQSAAAAAAVLKLLLQPPVAPCHCDGLCGSYMHM
jgi:hypothetical protein